MKVKVLGCYGRYAPVGGATSGYLVTTDSGKNIVIDMGAGCLSKLQEYISIADIDMIILSHLHFDHCSDMGTLNYASAYLGVGNIKVYMPATPKDMYAVMSKGFDSGVITEDRVIDLDGVRITFAKTTHPVETYAVTITDNGKTLCYTSDCALPSDIIDLVSRADVVIGDGCILASEHHANAPHLSVKQLAECMPDGTKLYLAHLTSGQETEILEEAKSSHMDSELVHDFEL